MNQRIALLLPFLLLVMACGGGDSFTSHAPAGSPDASPTALGEQTREILEDCVHDSLAQVADWVEFVEAVLDDESPGRETPDWGFAFDFAGIRLSPGLPLYRMGPSL